MGAVGRGRQYAGFYGDYRFSTDNALPVGVPFVGIKEGRGGLGVSRGRGLGAGYDIWSTKCTVNWPF